MRTEGANGRLQSKPAAAIEIPTEDFQIVFFF